MGKETAIDERVRERVKKNLEKSKKGMSAAKAKSGNSKVKSKKEPAPKNEVGIRIGSVLDTIYQCLKVGSTRAEILSALKKAHGDRDADGMEKTLKIQLYRMPKERGFTIRRDKESGKYTKVSGKSASPKKVKKEKAKEVAVEEEA